MRDVNQPEFPVLRAMGIGGFWGGLISCLFLGWWGLVVAVVIFVVTALIAGTLGEARRRKD